MSGLWTLPVAYLLGSVPLGYWIPRAMHGIDIRTVGSGNTGFTNVYRAVGVVPGLIVLVADVAKGALAVLIARAAGEGAGLIALAGAAAVAGHIWSLFLRFRGGKGVATAAGVLFSILPIEAALSLAVFGVTVAAGRYISLGSVAAALSFPIWTLILGSRAPNGVEPPYLALAVVIAALITVRHRANIRRLLAGKESRFSLSRGKGEKEGRRDRG
ncbi:MAG: glycerol-3-phosphate 1-O-acyltransferase PlsY [Candidatus Eisenbacteria bacterium]|nr:glycerol-3-phosphate 1-O-acyltransferase PlsY [Candidatus Eisenbacteria bacterium]